jgi:hypothetical protein
MSGQNPISVLLAVFLVDLGDLVSIYAGTLPAYNTMDQLDYK